ncbi:hypothetical protein DPMN_097569 [Dreissena polymorpha]|uniref:RIH domain-containing protein n=1 Tax=Dreissena polymorpha TaxID=45954 RepID=A0A9D4LBZ2_DREPO|nr:hypothetical protein DPMN_097569 [Dreissena polymorpha]
MGESTRHKWVYRSNCKYCMCVAEHEEKQNKLRALRNRQDLFQEEGMIALILETIDKFGQYKGKRQFAHYAGEEAANKWDDISSYLYLLLGTKWSCD